MKYFRSFHANWGGAGGGKSDTAVRREADFSDIYCWHAHSVLEQFSHVIFFLQNAEIKKLCQVII